MTDEDDDGLLIGNAAPLQPPIIPCSGMHPTVPLFAHNTSCAHALEVGNLPVCGGVLITDPSSLQMYGGDDVVNDINIPIPSLVANKATAEEPKPNASVGVNKKVQFQSVQHHPPSSAPSQSYHIAQFAGHSEPRQFVLPVSMATPHLGDLYCHGTAIAYNANFSTSVDSTASYNSYNSCASCNYALQQGGSVQPGEQCASQTGSLDHAPIGTEPSTDSRSSSLKQQQSVESIWIELPSRFHIRSNSTPSEETNLNTVIYNTPTGSAMNRHSPLTEEPAYGEAAQADEAPEAAGRKVARSKSDELVRSTTKVDRKARSLELPAKPKAIQKEKSALKSKTPSRQSSSRRSSRPHYHSVDHIDHNLPHSTPHIQRYHSSTGQLVLERSSLDRSSTEQLCRPTKAELLKRKRKRKAPPLPVELLLRKEHYKSDNLILKSRHKLRELSEEFRSSLTHRPHPFRPLHRSLTESETSSCLTRSMASCSSSSELDRTKAANSRPVQVAGRKRSEEQRKRDLAQVLARKSLSTTDSTENETERSANKRSIEYYANIRTRSRSKDDSTTITIQSSESSSEFERLADEQQQVNRLDSIRERTPDSADPFCQAVNMPAAQATAAAAGQQSARKFKVYQSATMFNLSSAFDEPTESLIGDLWEQRPIRRHQSAEQMLKRIIRSVHDYYRKQFKS